ncbi:hypothetical protein [Methylobacterium fujisawaense]|uniref:hypothetical protein n=1 Tax=Methylobacterium fujisawaense TaxID=107400 RepID=UPI0036FE03F6
MSATEIIMEAVGIEFEPHYAAKLAAVRVRLVPDRVAFDPTPNAGTTKGAKPRARPLNPELRKHGGINEEFDQPRGQRRGEHIFVAADRIEEAWRRVPNFPDPQAIWRAQAAMAWVATRAALILPDLCEVRLARQLFQIDPKSQEAWLKLGSDPTRLCAYFAILTGETDFWRSWYIATPDPPQEVLMAGEVYQVSYANLD